MLNVRPLTVYRKKEAMILIVRADIVPTGLVLPEGVACVDDPNLVQAHVEAIPADAADWLKVQVGDRVIIGVPSGFQRVNALALDKKAHRCLVSSKFILGVVESEVADDVSSLVLVQ